MSIAKARKEYYLQRKQEKKDNIVSGIPWHLVFPKLGSIIPTIPKGYQILWTANSGVGKTTTWMGIVLYSIYKIKKEHPELNLKIKLIIALLEDTKEMFIDRLYSMLLYELFQVRLDNFSLQSLRDAELDDKYVPMLDVVEEEINKLLEDCEIIDSIYNPTGLYKWCRTITNKYGKHVYKDKEFVHEDGSKTIEKVYSHYELNDPQYQFLLVTDNLNNLAQEVRDGKLLTLLETINLWSRSYCRLQITKHWKWTVLNIIQQSAESEKQQYDLRGNPIIEKTKPSLDGLGNSKECQRDHFIVIGAWAASRYGVREYPVDNGYDVERMGDNFRVLIILKSNLSQTNIEIPVYFDGGICKVKELPKPGEMTDAIYKLIEENKVKP